MMEKRRIDKFDIEVPRRHALRLLGVKKKSRPPRESVMAVFEEEYAAAKELIDATALMLISHGGIPGSVYLDPAMPLVAVICTIGPALEERVAALSDSGDLMAAVILDAIGSAAAEEVADQSNRLICAMTAVTDFAPDSRRSPGYGTWNIREQEAIFRFLKPEEIGVTLTETCMMVPRKSISYVVPLEGGRRGDGPGGRCVRCGVKNCPYRDEGGIDGYEWLMKEGG